MRKTIKEEIIDYLKEHDMYYVDEFDEEGFPVDDKTNGLISYLTNAELCDILIESMEYIAEIQRKKDIEKAWEAYRKELTDIIAIFNKLGKELYNINELGELISLEGSLKDFRKAMEEEL